MRRQETAERLIRAIVHRRCRQTDFQRALPFAVNRVAARPRHHADNEQYRRSPFDEFNHWLLRSPKSAVPRRI